MEVGLGAIRRKAIGLIATAICALSLAGTLSACGEGYATLTVAVTTDDAQPYSPGDVGTFTVTVTNFIASTSGVTVHVDLPAGFHYKDTRSLAGTGVRTSPDDPQVNSTSPVWGIWNLSDVKQTIVITFEAIVGGAPGSPQIMARAAGDNTESETKSKPLAVQVAAAPSLQMGVAVTPSSVHQGQQVTYTVTITNNGTGIAGNVGILVTLPPVIIFNSTSGAFNGNSSRNGGVDPQKGALEVFYNGFDVPAQSTFGPGLLVVSFKCDVLKNAGATGSYSVGAQVTDAQGDVVNLNETAPLQIS